MLPKLPEFKEHMKALGVGLDTPVVCYDTGDKRWAGRTAWLLTHYGHDNVKVLAETVDYKEESGLVTEPKNGRDFSYCEERGAQGLLTTFEQVLEV